MSSVQPDSRPRRRKIHRLPLDGTRRNSTELDTKIHWAEAARSTRKTWSPGWSTSVSQWGLVNFSDAFLLQIRSMNQMDGILEFQVIFALFLLSFSNPTKQQHVWEGYGGIPSTVIHLDGWQRFCASLQRSFSTRPLAGDGLGRKDSLHSATKMSVIVVTLGQRLQ